MCRRRLVLAVACVPEEHVDVLARHGQVTTGASGRAGAGAPEAPSAHRERGALAYRGGIRDELDVEVTVEHQLSYRPGTRTGRALGRCRHRVPGC